MRAVSTRAALLPLAVALGAMAVLDGPHLAGQRPSSRAPEVRLELVDGIEAAAGEALVKFRRGARPAAPDPALELVAAEEVARGIRWLRSRSLSARQLVQHLSRRPDVEYAEPNYVLRASAVPNDPDFPRQWALRNLQFPGADIRATGAWDITRGTAQNVVAVIDSGIDYTHPDLAPNLWAAPTAFTVRIDGVVNRTCPAGTHGYDALFNSCDPVDWNGHGTAVSGAIGAAGDNGMGISGVNWHASIMPIKFIGSDGIGFLSEAIRGIDVALQIREYFASTGAANVRVMNNSYGGGGFSRAMLEMIERTHEQDVLFVAAAGNSNQDNDAQPFYPASYDVPNVVAVAATQEADQRAAYSSYGERTVHLGAPDWGWTTLKDGRYGDVRGTSMAGAVVSGAAALVLAACDLNLVQLKHVLLDTVDPLSTLRTRTVTGGRLNVERAIHACSGRNAAPFVTLTSPSPGDRFTVGQTITIAAEAWDRDGMVARVDFFADARLVGSATAAPYEASWSPQRAGGYRLTVAATDDGGATTWSSETPSIVVEWPPVSLPSPWETADVGTAALPGHAVYDDGTFTVTGGSGDVWGTMDDFRYVYQPLHGDGQIVARVVSVEHVHAWTKAGVMIRESLHISSPHAFMLVSGENGLAFQRRRTQGGKSIHTSGGPGMAPSWVKLVRSGQTISAFGSADGTSWQLVGSDTFSMAALVYVGLALSSHRSTALATAVFDHVGVNDASAPALPGGWTSRDVGLVGLAGSASESGGTFTLRGSGADIWGGADGFQFVSRALAGNGEIVARVASVEAGHHWAKAGVMMRESLAGGSRHAFMLVSRARGLAFQRRVSSNGLSTHTSGGDGTAPRWVRLVRVGDTFSAYWSVNGTDWSLVGQETIAMEATLQVGLALTSHDNGALAAAGFDAVRVVEAEAIWRNQDIGSVGRAGGAWEQNGVFTLDGSGADIWGTGDGFHFVYRPLEGDGEIVARVGSLEAGHHWAKAGVMIRETLTAGSSHAFMLVSRARGLAFQRRVGTGGLSTHTDAGAGGAPGWVRLVRSGNTVQAYRSADGTTWTEVGSETIGMSATVYAGLALTSHDNAALARAVFDSVSVHAAGVAVERLSGLSSPRVGPHVSSARDPQETH